MKTRWTQKDQEQAVLKYGWGVFSNRKQPRIRHAGQDIFRNDAAAREHVLSWAFYSQPPLPRDIETEVQLCRKAIAYIVCFGD
jgi:hypothetical protein